MAWTLVAATTLASAALGQTHLEPRNLTIPGDNLADAIVVPASRTDTLSNVGATLEAGEVLPSCGVGGGNSIWWRYTATKTTIVSANTNGSTFDTILAVFKGTAHPLTEVVCNDDNGAPSGSSSVSFFASKDSTYYFRVAGVDDAAGDAVLTLPFTLVWFAVRFTGKVLLEGAHSSDGMMSIGDGFGSSIPTNQPYSDPAYNGTILDYDGTDSTSALPEGAIDWVLISLRTGPDPSTEVTNSERAVIVLEDGSIVDRDGNVVMFGLSNIDDSYYVVLRHRNHLSVMSSGAVNGSWSWDFTSAGQAYSTGPAPQKDLGDGHFAMFAGDADHDGQIAVGDFNAWLPATKAAEAGYVVPDFDLDGQVTVSDFNLWLANTKMGAFSQVPE